MRPGALALAIAQSIADRTREDFEATATERVAGGSIHEAWQLTGGTPRGERHWFVKVAEAQARPMFEAEARGLGALAEASALRVPAACLVDADDERSWLVLEWLDLEPLASASGARLGEGLARQHRVTRERFGADADNFIGATPQANGWQDDWLAFWRQRRLVPQLRLAAKNRLPSRTIDRGERLADDCEPFFRGHRPQASLLHGDLWGGNAAALPDGTPVAFDPAMFFGDREADLAMTELFGGFPPDFQAAYGNAWPLADGYAVRRDFYNLYHVLNHANLFAGAYVAQAGHCIERLLSELA